MREASTSNSLANEMGRGYEQACLTLCRGGFDHQPVPRKRVHGVCPSGNCAGVKLEEAVAQTTEILTQSGRCFLSDQTVYFARPQGEHLGLEPIWGDGTLGSNAKALLANLMITCTLGDRPVESVPAPKFLAAVLSDEQLQAALPRIRHRTTRGGFVADFVVCQSGWNPDSGIFVEGPGLVPATLGPAPSTGPYLDRLPPRLRRLIGEFAFRAEADVAGFVAMLLTGVLVNHFIEVPHPAVLVDGNQPSVGKSLLIQVLGRVLDGFDPAPIPFSGDEELAKHLGAQILAGRSCVYFFDNLRREVDSVLIESQILAPRVTVRLLGRSALIERPNAYLFCFTSNGMVATRDLVTRSVPIQLRYDGNAETRDFTQDPLEYAAEHRAAILGELAGLVQRWCEAGRPQGDRPHRCRRWAQLIGGILKANGLDGPFLANLLAARAEMDAEQLKFNELAAEARKEPPGSFWSPAGSTPDDLGRPAADWAMLFERAGLSPRQPQVSDRSRTTILGKQLKGWATRDAEALPGPPQPPRGPPRRTPDKSRGRRTRARTGGSLPPDY